MKESKLLADLLTGAFVVIVRPNPDTGGMEILTQTRDCRKKPKDMAYHGTQECVGERSEWSPGKTFPAIECVLETADRGRYEETGVKNSGIKILGAGGKIAVPLVSTTGRDDLMMVVDPYTFYQTLEGPVIRFAPCFIAVVPSSYTPIASQEGEVEGFTWWSPEDLLHALRNESWRFSYAHPILLKLCQDIVEAGLVIGL